MSAKFLHTADIHLDSSFDRLPPEKASQRREEQFNLLRNIISAAEDNRCDAILIAGDLFEKTSPSFGIGTRTAEILGNTALPIFISPGNHDFFSSRSAYSLTKWSSNVHIFSSPEIACIPFAGINIYGAGFVSQELTFSPLRGFHADNNQKSVMLLHADLNSSDPRYCPITSQEIAASGLSYLALGHIHLRTEPQTFGETICAYPGCPEGRGFDETGEKGCYIVEIGDSVNVNFLPLRGRRMEIIDISLTPGHDALSEISSSLPPDCAQNILKIRLTGEYAPENLDIVRLENALGGRAFHIEISDLTHPPRNIWSAIGNDSLEGVFLSLILDKLDSAKDDGERTELELAARFGLAALNGEEAPK